MSFKFYEWVILIFVGLSAGWAWIESARGSLLADFVAIGLTFAGLVLFIVFAVGALKRGAEDRAVGTFQDGAEFAERLSKQSQINLVNALRLGMQIQAGQNRVLLQDSRNAGYLQKANANMMQKEHSFGIDLAKKLGSSMFQLFKDQYNPADQYADPGAGQGQAPADDWSDMFVDAEHYDQDGR